MGSWSKRKQNTSKRLAHGRPPVFRPHAKKLSSKATKALINRHHVLGKKKKQAELRHDQEGAQAIESELASLGGITAYQQASLQGQGNDRGGDSSKILMEWLRPATDLLRKAPLRMLEVGALSTSNACSKSSCFSMERIDLHSQEQGIMQQDFLCRPLPRNDSDRFDIISLSLVLNYVPDARDRGKMLWRTLAFLRKPDDIDGTTLGSFFPSVFLVLPAPCITNSRYTDENLLDQVMTSLGFKKVHYKFTNKLAYYLWRRVSSGLYKSVLSLSKKNEVRSGPSRNNFSIILEASWPTWPIESTISDG